MAFALIASAVGGSGYPTDTTSTTPNIDTTGANLIVIAVSSYSDATIPTITDSKGNTWTNISHSTLTGNGRSSLYYCLNPIVGSGHYFTTAQVGSYANILAMAFSGAKATSALENNTGATTLVSGATSLATGSITPTEDNELIVSALCFGATNTISIDSGMTIAQQAQYYTNSIFGIMGAYKIQTTATAINPLASWGTSTPASASIACFKAEPVVSQQGRGFFGIL